MSIFDNIVGLYNFNGSANDGSGNGNHGVVTGATLTTDRFGNANSSYLFDAVNPSYIRLGDTPYDITTDVTYAFGMYCTSWGVGMILSKYAGGATGHMEIQTATSSGRNILGILFRGTINNQLYVGYSGEFTFSTNTWYDVVITYNNSTGNVRLYVDGVFIKENIQNVGMGNNSNQLTIGARASDTTLYKYAGKIEYFYPYNRILSDAEIASISKVKKGNHSLLSTGEYLSRNVSNFGVDMSGVSAIYLSDGATTINEVSGNLNGGTAAGNVTYSSDDVGNYADFNGDSNFSAGTGVRAEYTIGNKMNFSQTTDFSWSVTCSVLSLQPNNSSGIFGSAYDCGLTIGSYLGHVYFGLRGSTQVTYSLGTNYLGSRLGEIHTYGFTYKASELKFYCYLDGVLQNTSGTVGPTTFLTNEWGIGDRFINGGNASSCRKRIYHAEVFPRALTALEHLQIHEVQIGKTPRIKGKTMTKYIDTNTPLSVHLRQKKAILQANAIVTL